MADNSDFQLQGRAVVLKFGKVVYVRFGIYIKNDISKGTVLGELSVSAKNSLLNNVIYNQTVLNTVSAFDVVGKYIQAQGAIPKGSYLISIMYEAA